MKTLISTASLSGVLALTLLVSPAFSQSSDQHKHNGDTPADASTDLGAELRRLQGKVAELEGALATQHREKYGADSSSGGSTMKSMNKMGGMGKGKMSGMKGMSQDSKGSMSGMGKGMGGMGMGMMSAMKGKKGMMGMGMMGMNPAMSSDSMAGMDMPSALPGFPGASHLYHIGETGFFLDHPEHITLTDEQQKKLNVIKESSLLATSTAERKIEEAEQDLWKLTAVGEPDIKKIESKAKEIAQLRVGTRIAFIRSVGEAAGVLTKEQRNALVGEGKK